MRWSEVKRQRAAVGWTLGSRRIGGVGLGVGLGSLVLVSSVLSLLGSLETWPSGAGSRKLTA